MLQMLYNWFRTFYIIGNLILCVSLLGGLVFLTGFDKPKPIKIGDQPPEFFLSDLNGNLRGLYQFKGKVVVLYFWADWCCKDRTLLTDNQFYQKYKEKGLVLLAINSGQPKKVVERFVQERKVTYDVLLDLRFTATKQYGVVSLPMIFILDREGIVRNRILGQVEIGYLEKAVLNLLWSNIGEPDGWERNLLSSPKKEKQERGDLFGGVDFTVEQTHGS